MSIILSSLLLFYATALSHAPPSSSARPLDELIAPVVLIQSAGSTCAGSLVDAQGHIITAEHCVEARRPIFVTTVRGERHRASLHRTDASNDLAILIVEELAGAPALTLGHSSVVGESVTVVGHPFGSLANRVPALDGLLRWTVTSGTVSAVGPHLIQLDAAFNPGTSGGPVLNEMGELIGVASRKLRGESLAFAIPAQMVSNLIEEGSVPFVTGNLDLDAGLILPANDLVTSLLLGPRLTILDRFLIEARVGVAIGSHRRTLSYGQSSWRGWDAQLYWRSRLTLDDNSLTIDLGGGLAGLESQIGETTIEGLWQVRPAASETLYIGNIRVGLGGWRMGLYGTDGDYWGLSVERTLVNRLFRF